MKSLGLVRPKVFVLFLLCRFFRPSKSSSKVQVSYFPIQLSIFSSSFGVFVICLQFSSMLRLNKSQGFWLLHLFFLRYSSGPSSTTILCLACLECWTNLLTCYCPFPNSGIKFLLTIEKEIGLIMASINSHKWNTQ